MSKHCAERRDVRNLLLITAQKTLETMFFVVPDSISADPRRPAGELIAACLTFDGPSPGRFSLLVSDATARTLATNFAGCDDSAELFPGRVTSVVGELANMICGAVLSELESDANFDLGAPQSLLVGANEPVPDFAGPPSSACRLEFPDGTLVLFLAFGTSS